MFKPSCLLRLAVEIFSANSVIFCNSAEEMSPLSNAEGKANALRVKSVEKSNEAFILSKWY